MPRASLPPLLRGLGTSLLLLSAALTVVYERDKDETTRLSPVVVTAPAAPSPDPVLLELRQMRAELAEDRLADDVFENPWFQWLSLLGTGLIAASFFVEWRVRVAEVRGEQEREKGNGIGEGGVT